MRKRDQLAIVTEELNHVPIFCFRLYQCTSSRLGFWFDDWVIGSDKELSLRPRQPEFHADEMKSTKQLAQDALDANKVLQSILTQRAQQLEADLKEVDELLVSVFRCLS